MHSNFVAVQTSTLVDRIAITVPSLLSYDADKWFTQGFPSLRLDELNGILNKQQQQYQNAGAAPAAAAPASIRSFEPDNLMLDLGCMYSSKR
jgi:hypothetical protein